jgi:hypothetical protein
MKYRVLWLDRKLVLPDIAAVSLILLSASQTSTWSCILLEKPIILLLIFYRTEVYHNFVTKPPPDPALMK